MLRHPGLRQCLLAPCTPSTMISKGGAAFLCPDFQLRCLALTFTVSTGPLGTSKGPKKLLRQFGPNSCHVYLENFAFTYLEFLYILQIYIYVFKEESILCMQLNLGDHIPRYICAYFPLFPFQNSPEALGEAPRNPNFVLYLL